MGSETNQQSALLDALILVLEDSSDLKRLTSRLDEANADKASLWKTAVVIEGSLEDRIDSLVEAVVANGMMQLLLEQTEFCADEFERKLNLPSPDEIPTDPRARLEALKSRGLRLERARRARSGTKASLMDRTFLVDRVTQVKEVKECRQNYPTSNQPIFIVIFGDDGQGHDELVERLADHDLPPHFWGRNTSKKMLRYSISLRKRGWIDGAELKKEISSLLSEQIDLDEESVDLDQPALKLPVEHAPVLVDMHLSNSQDPRFVLGAIRYWLAVPPNSRAKYPCYVCLCLRHLKPAARHVLWKIFWIWKRARLWKWPSKGTERLAEFSKARVLRRDFRSAAPLDDLRVVSLEELGNVTIDEVRAWVKEMISLPSLRTRALRYVKDAFDERRVEGLPMHDLIKALEVVIAKLHQSSSY